MADEQQVFRPAIERPHPTYNAGKQRIYTFKNGYGASAVQGNDECCRNLGLPTEGLFGLFGHGLHGDEYNNTWEVAIIWFDPERDGSYDIVYDTPITEDVIGHVNDELLQQLLRQIAALPPRTTKPLTFQERMNAKYGIEIKENER